MKHFFAFLGFVCAVLVATSEAYPSCYSIGTPCSNCFGGIGCCPGLICGNGGICTVQTTQTVSVNYGGYNLINPCNGCPVCNGGGCGCNGGGCGCNGGGCGCNGGGCGSC